MIITAATATAVAAALTGCSSTTAGTPTSSGSGTGSGAGNSSASSTGGSSSSPTTSPATSSGGSAASTPEGLAAILRAGLGSTRSAHITLRITTGGQSIVGSGDETITAGVLHGLDLTETFPGVGALRIIQVGGKTYVQLPVKLRTSSQPYSLVTTSSSDPTVRSLAQSLQSSSSTTAVDSAGVFARAARSVADRGQASVNGVRTTHYYVVVDVAKLPGTYAGRGALLQAGLKTLPIDLYVDSEGRPVQVTERLTVGTLSVATDLGVTKYNQPVTISAPPASQVSTR